ncbi:hypothetical protein KQI63_05620 [bacterium]|nr:hypothetical protein [bacterium]
MRGRNKQSWGGGGGQGRRHRRKRNGVCRESNTGSSSRSIDGGALSEVLLAVAVPVVRFAGKLLRERVQHLLAPSRTTSERRELEPQTVRKVKVLSSEPVEDHPTAESLEEGDHAVHVIEESKQNHHPDQEQEEEL